MTRLIDRMIGKVVGWSWLRVQRNEFFKEGVYGEINELHVVRSWRRRGIGQVIMNHGFRWFRVRGVRTVRVEALARNKPALRFYTKLGFRPYYLAFQKVLERIDRR